MSVFLVHIVNRVPVCPIVGNIETVHVILYTWKKVKSSMARSAPEENLLPLFVGLAINSYYTCSDVTERLVAVGQSMLGKWRQIKLTLHYLTLSNTTPWASFARCECFSQISVPLAGMVSGTSSKRCKRSSGLCGPSGYQYAKMMKCEHNLTLNECFISLKRLPIYMCTICLALTYYFHQIYWLLSRVTFVTHQIRATGSMFIVET